jgi:nucleoside-diphosphate-sugar epimerase
LGKACKDDSLGKDCFYFYSRMKSAVIGCGWLGFPLAVRLKELGHDVYGSSTREQKMALLEENGIFGFVFDGFEQSKIPEKIQHVDLLIVNFPPSRSMDYKAQVQDLIAQFSPETNVIFTSSTGVYQDAEGICDETAPCILDHPVYLAEEVVRKSGKSATILRLAGLISEDRNPVKYLSGKLNADGQKVVNLVHREDVIEAIVAVVKNKVWNETFNVCIPEHPTREAYYSKQAKLAQLPAPTFSFSIGMGKEVDSSKMQKQLSFRYSHSL